MDRYKNMEKILKVYANRRRLKILKYLEAHPAASVNEIAEVIKLSVRSTSKHLMLLKSIKAVETKQISNHVFHFSLKSLPEPGDKILSLV